jgi:hypothetical protein
MTRRQLHRPFCGACAGLPSVCLKVSFDMTHRSIHAFAILDNTHTSTTAQMANDNVRLLYRFT